MTQDYNAISIEFLRIIIVRCLHRYNNEKIFTLPGILSNFTVVFMINRMYDL
jgi:hypothetical protein